MMIKKVKKTSFIAVATGVKASTNPGPFLLNNEQVVPDSALVIQDTTVINGDFSAGSSGWTLGAGAKVRQQGWVCKIQNSSGSGYATVEGNYITTGFTPGTSTYQIKGWLKKSANFADSDNNLALQASAFNSGGTIIGSALASTVAVGTDWAYVTSSAVTIPALTTKIGVDFYTYLQTAGVGYCGPLELYVDGALVAYIDWADEATGWTLPATASITYDPANAYMGNSMDGTARNTLVVQGDAGYTNGANFFPVTPGDQYILSGSWKKIIDPATLFDRPKVHWYSGPSFGSTFIGATELPNISVGSWVSNSVSVTIPTGAYYGVIILVDAAVADGLWLVGEVSVSKVLYSLPTPPGTGRMEMVATEQTVLPGDTLTFTGNTLYTLVVESVLSTYYVDEYIQNTYLAYQLSGPVAQSLADTVLAEIAKNQPVVTYFGALNVDTCADKELEFLGYLAGYPWPIYPTTGPSENFFLFSDATLYPETSAAHGLSDANDLTLGGGLLTSTEPFYGEKIPASMYRVLLKQFAYIAYNGVSIETIDKVCNTLGKPYLIQYGSEIGTLPPEAVASDVFVTFQETIGFNNIWILRALVQRVCTAPQVFFIDHV